MCFFCYQNVRCSKAQPRDPCALRHLRTSQTASVRSAGSDDQNDKTCRDGGMDSESFWIKNLVGLWNEKNLYIRWFECMHIYIYTQLYTYIRSVFYTTWVSQIEPSRLPLVWLGRWHTQDNIKLGQPPSQELRFASGGWKRNIFPKWWFND